MGICGIDNASKTDLSIELLSQLIFDLLYWFNYRYLIAFYLSDNDNNKSNITHFLFTLLFHQLSIRRWKIYYNISRYISTSIKNNNNCVSRLILFSDESDEYQWHARCAIDITIRFYCSMLTGILISIEWFIVGKSIFNNNKSHFKNALLYNLISILIELIYYFCVFIVDYKIQKVFVWQKLHSIVKIEKTYRKKFFSWCIVTLSIQFLIFLFGNSFVID